MKAPQKQTHADAYKSKLDALARQLHQLEPHTDAEGVALGKEYSNLFRRRHQGRVSRLDVRDLNRVIKVDPVALVADVEGMTTYQTLVHETLKHGLLPTVVPELKTITIGGAIAGGGIEASSFKYGLVHETILEMEILLSAGRVVVATPANDHKDLFFGIPNTFGTLGYVVRVKVQLVKAKPFVELRHVAFTNSTKFFEAIAQVAATRKFKGKTVDFMDGTVFSPGKLFLTLGRMVDAAPYMSDYTYKHIYYRSIAKRSIDYLTIEDFIWRWDTDWFWCSRQAQNPVVRRLLGRRRLNSQFYWRALKVDRKYQISRKIARLRGDSRKYEPVIQDVQIPIERAPEFLDFFEHEIGIKPIWICPTKQLNPADKFVFLDLAPGKAYINFGFWDTVVTEHDPAKGYYNRLVEAKVRQLGGNKGLYSDSFYSETEFWQLFDQAAYNKLKAKYDPKKIFKDLYVKCVKNR